MNGKRGMNSKYDYGDAVVRSVPLFHVGLSPKGKRYVRAALGGGTEKRGDRGLRWLSRINRVSV